MRLGRFLAHAGAASRRASETLVRDGRVTVNGTIVLDPARDVAESDRILLDGRPVRLLEKAVTILLYKPLGVLSTVSDPQGRPTVVDLVGQGRGDRLYPVGRLDRDSEGLLLLSNDGAFTRAMTHPSHQVPKTYEAWVEGHPGPAALARMRNGLMLEGETRPTAPADVEILRAGPDAALIRMTLREGRNRQVRRMCGAVGHPVRSLRRVGFGFLTLDGLAPGQWRPLEPEEIEGLLGLAR